MGEIKIAAGKFKGRSIKVPNEIRPTTSRIKLIIFDTLSEIIPESDVLDLFAGSGNMGLESLSRGAKSATLVDHNTDTINTIKENIVKLGVDSDAKVVQSDYKRFLKKNEDKFDLIFVDPPFNLIDELKYSFFSPSLRQGGILVLKLKSGSKIKLPANLEVIRYKKEGSNEIYFVREI